FTTYEKIQELLISVKKESGKLENYTKEKLEKSFLIACNKRPITRIQILKIIENIENKIRNNFKNEISSKTLGEYVMEELKILDPISYIRYASVYKDFDDLDKFNQELILLKVN
ncbi:transcriptional repressor NrdR, partial [Candidatus Woesearchaeota archaeon]|nr:transcriptional repressor NrdR [Candidatus Woesearchaeota archaeon]